ncbi:MAG TPA: adenosylcobinamide-GDP ribazoletransferase [Thermoleophilia bacterium]|nr:adenosylcobinamide-GDP ribazoletransferase [Thermoleophilia bacterium]
MSDEQNDDTTASAQSAAGGRGWLAARVRHFDLAVTFLSAVRLPDGGAAVPAADLWASMAFYPLIGLLLGLAAWGLYALLLYAVTPLLAAALVIVAIELVTRALHLDGLMDTADGYLSGAPRERALEIMKDSRVGAMGVFAAVAVIVVKVSALAALARSGAALGLIAGLSAARLVPVLDVRYFAYARREGTGAAFAGAGSTNGPVVAAVATAAVAALVVGAIAWPGATGAFLTLGVALVAIAVSLGAQALVARRLGGLTGDVYGLGVELAEAVALIGAVMIVR